MIKLSRINEEAQWKIMNGAHILVDDSGKIIAGPDPSKKSGQNSKKKALIGKKKTLAKKKSRMNTRDALARSEALLKKLNINESINPFKGMKKVESEDNPRATYATDGYGNTYEVPKTGYSDTIRIANGDDEFLVRYNYKNKEVEVSTKSDKEIMHSIQLNVLDWIDNPEYWAETAISELDAEIGLNEATQPREGFNIEYFNKCNGSGEYHLMEMIGERLAKELRSNFQDIPNYEDNYQLDVNYRNAKAIKDLVRYEFEVTGQEAEGQEIDEELSVSLSNIDDSGRQILIVKISSDIRNPRLKPEKRIIKHKKDRGPKSWLFNTIADEIAAIYESTDYDIDF